MIPVVIAASSAILFTLWCIEKCRDLYLEKSKLDKMAEEIKISSGDTEAYKTAVEHFNKSVAEFPSLVFAKLMKYKRI